MAVVGMWVWRIIGVWRGFCRLSCRVKIFTTSLASSCRTQKPEPFSIVAWHSRLILALVNHLPVSTPHSAKRRGQYAQAGRAPTTATMRLIALQVQQRASQATRRKPTRTSTGLLRGTAAHDSARTGAHDVLVAVAGTCTLWSEQQDSAEQRRLQEVAAGGGRGRRTLSFCCSWRAITELVWLALTRATARATTLALSATTFQLEELLCRAAYSCTHAAGGWCTFQIVHARWAGTVRRHGQFRQVRGTSAGAAPVCICHPAVNGQGVWGNPLIRSLLSTGKQQAANPSWDPRSDTRQAGVQAGCSDATRGARC
jgi:hypothetical protein